MTMPVGLADTLSSERGVFALLLLLAVTVMLVFKILPVETWLDFVKWLAAALITSKTLTTAVETVALKKPQIPKTDATTKE